MPARIHRRPANAVATIPDCIKHQSRVVIDRRRTSFTRWTICKRFLRAKSANEPYYLYTAILAAYFAWYPPAIHARFIRAHLHSNGRRMPALFTEENKCFYG